MLNLVGVVKRQLGLESASAHDIAALRALHVFSSPEYRSVVERAVEFFATTPVHAMPPPRGITGVGVYSIYYVGDFPAYQAMSAANKSSPVPTIPCYIGKAVPEGSRAGRMTDAGNKTVVGRLAEHGRSIAASERHAEITGAPILHLADFRCRFVILEDLETDLIATLESALIRKYKPIWNAVIDGFGNHDPGSGRYAQARSEWDVLHPGRSFANRLTGLAPTLDAVLTKVATAMERVIISNAVTTSTEEAVTAVAIEHEVASNALSDD